MREGIFSCGDLKMTVFLREVFLRARTQEWENNFSRHDQL